MGQHPRWTSRAFSLLLFVPLFMGARCRNHEVEVDPDGGSGLDLPQKEQLQVVSIDPAWHAADEAFQATLYGSDFEQGARVRFGEESEAVRVEVLGANRIRVTVPALAQGSWDVWVISPSGERAVLRGGLQIQEPGQGADPMAACSDVVVYFDLDSHRLTASSKQQLAGQISCLQQAPGTIWLDGHTDERGTTEYNMALGQRRAEQVRGYLISEGLSPQRMQSRSFGEEVPAATGHSERDWSLNRRVELVVER